MSKGRIGMFHDARQPNKVIRRLCEVASNPLIEKEKLCRRHNLQICPRGLHQPDSSSTKLTPRDVKHKLNSQGLCAWSFTQGLLYEIQVHYNIWLHN